MTQDILPRQMVLDEFTPYLHAVFTADCTPESVDLTLVDAYPLKDSGVLERPPFMLIFRSDPMACLVEGIYVLRSGAFGPAAISLLNTGAAPGSPPGHYYQAIFN